MLISAFAALVMFAAPEATQASATPEAKPAKSAEAKAAPARTCYTATPSGSRMPRKVCVTDSARSAEKAEKDLKAEAKPE